MFRRAAILILVTAALAACGGDPTDTGSDAGGNGPDAGGNQDTQAPTLLSSSPSNGTTGMAVGGSFTVTFSEPMDPQSVLLELRPSVGLGGASWNAEGTSVSYAPLVELSAGVTYSVTVSGKDLAGNGLTGTNSFSFTAAATDTTAPTVRTTTPATGATNVSPTAAFNISFSEPMDTGTVTVDLSPTASVELSWDAESTTLTALAPAGLAFGTSYTVTLNGKDVAGNALGGTTTFSFTTSTPADATAPEVASGSPANGTTGVSTSTNISRVLLGEHGPALGGECAQREPHGHLLLRVEHRQHARHLHPRRAAELQHLVHRDARYWREGPGEQRAGRRPQLLVHDRLGAGHHQAHRHRLHPGQRQQGQRPRLQHHGGLLRAHGQGLGADGLRHHQPHRLQRGHLHLEHRGHGR